jgi:hypothetical protein
MVQVPAVEQALFAVWIEIEAACEVAASQPPWLWPDSRSYEELRTATFRNDRIIADFHARMAEGHIKSRNG